MAMSKMKIEALNKELAELLASFAERNGLSKGNQRISYNDATFKLSVEFGELTATGGHNPAFLKDLMRYGWQHGLDQKMLGKRIKLARGEMEFVGMKSNKYAILADTDKKYWKYDVVPVAQSLKSA